MEISIIRIALFSLAQMIATFGSAQQNINVSGIVKDSIDNAEISYTTVAISGTSVGTVTDQHGHFSLTLTPDMSKETITISCLGYESKRIRASDMKASENIFFLHRKAFSFHEITVSPKKKKEITAKMIEKMMAKISGPLYISKYETSTFLYWAFLDDICAHDDTACEEAGFHPIHTTYTTQYGSCDYQCQVAVCNSRSESWPVSDINYEGAKQFCLWLTKKYAQFKNRKFKNAIFRLPTSAEWTYAAQGGSKVKTRFPWPGDSAYYYRPNDTLRTWFAIYYDTTAKSQNYGGGYCSVFAGYKNKFGLANVCSNASEMVQEKGVYKGGCSMDVIENIGIYAPQEPNRKDPDYYIGFRFAMELKH